MGDVNQSASASAEANVAKISGNTVNFNQAPSSAVSGPTGIAKLARTIAPVWYEKREARALSVRADSLAETAQRLKEQFPVMSERRAVMEALGYRMTNEQADNVFDVMSEAQENLRHSGGHLTAILPEARDAIVESAKSAYEKDVKSLWAKLVAGELEQPGSYSKRTMSVLADMSAADAKSFSELCSAGVYACSGNTVSTDRPHIIMVKDESDSTFNNGLFNYAKRSQLESLGVIDSSIRSYIPLRPGESSSFIVGDRLVTARNDTDSDKEFSASPVLTKSGLELSRLCEIGSCSNLAEYLAKAIMKCELTVYSDLRTYEITGE